VLCIGPFFMFWRARLVIEDRGDGGFAVNG